MSRLVIFWLRHMFLRCCHPQSCILIWHLPTKFLEVFWFLCYKFDLWFLEIGIHQKYWFLSVRIYEMSQNICFANTKNATQCISLHFLPLEKDNILLHFKVFLILSKRSFKCQCTGQFEDMSWKKMSCPISSVFNEDKMGHFQLSLGTKKKQPKWEATKGTARLCPLKTINAGHK